MQIRMLLPVLLGLACGNRGRDEAKIRELIDGYARAVRTKDLDAVMAVYAPTIVSFDLEPPLQYVNTKRWNQTFAAYDGPLGYEITQLAVTVGDDVAFSHSLNHITGTLKTGKHVTRWVRWTACLQKLDGRWLIVHDHVSVPVDPATGAAAFDLTP